MNKQTGIIIGVVTVAIIVIGALAGLVIYNMPETVVTKTQEEAPAETTEPMADTQVTLPSDKYEDIYKGAKNEFMSGCLGEDASQSECSCMYDHLDSHLTNEEFTEYVTNVTEEDLGDAGWSAIRACYGN